MASVNNRIRFLDVAKGIGILMVTYGHITELDNPVDHYMSLYKITLFYFVSGYLLSYLNRYKETSFGKYFLGVCRHIALPYILFSAAAIGVRVLQAYMKADEDLAEVFMEHLTVTLNLTGIATLWFLPTIFFSQIILFIIVKYSDHIIGKIILASIFFWPAPVYIYWMRIGRYIPDSGFELVAAKSLIAVWFMAAGFIYHKYVQDHVDPRLRFTLGVVLTALTFWLSQYSMHIDFNMMKLGDIPELFFVGGITGSLGLLLVLEGLEHIYTPKLLEYFGINSLVIMCAQRGLKFLNLLTKGWREMFGGLMEELCMRYYMERVGILILLLLMTGGLIELINGSKAALSGVLHKDKGE